MQNAIKQFFKYSLLNRKSVILLLEKISICTYKTVDKKFERGHPKGLLRWTAPVGNILRDTNFTRRPEQREGQRPAGGTNRIWDRFRNMSVPAVRQKTRRISFARVLKCRAHSTLAGILHPPMTLFKAAYLEAKKYGSENGFEIDGEPQGFWGQEALNPKVDLFRHTKPAL